MGLTAFTTILGLMGSCLALRIPDNPLWDTKHGPRPKPVVDHPEDDPLHPDHLHPYRHYEPSHHDFHHPPPPHPWIDPHDEYDHRPGYYPGHPYLYKPDPYDHHADYYHGYPAEHAYPYKPHPYEHYPKYDRYAWPHQPEPDYHRGQPEVPPLPYPSHKVFHPYEDTTPGCEWRVVFKAVAGNHHSVYEDYMHLGNINTHIPYASAVSSPLVYRDGEVLDRWDHIIVPKVKVELFVHGVRGVWFIFDGLGSTFTDWFDRDRLLASPYHDIKTGEFQFYSIVGDAAEQNRFFITRELNEDCVEDCGFLAVVDRPEEGHCPWQEVGHRPLFLYTTLTDTCGLYQSHDEVQYADRFVISVNLCDNHKLTE